jgi:hypothetical protein
MGSLRRGALVRRGIGELYVMVIIIVILVIALTIMYTVMSGFTKYLMEQKQEIVELESTKTSLKTGLKNFTCSGYSCIATVSVSGTTVITGPNAVCVFRNATVSVVSRCTYSVGSDGSVNVEIPPELRNDAQSSRVASSITIYLPGSDGLVPSITLYMGHVIAYAILNSSGNYAVIVVNNSTGWVNATLLVNNQPYSSHVVPPTGSYVFTNVPSGTYTLSINNIINEPIQTIQPSTYSYTVQQCASLKASGSYSYSPPLASPIFYGGYSVTYNGVINSYSGPTYMYTFEQGYYDAYVYFLYYPYQGTISGVVSLYPTDFTINETIFFAFVVLKNNTAIVAYWPSNTYPQSSAATSTSNTLNIIGQALQNARFPGVNVNNVEFIEVNPAYENTWLSYSFSCTPSTCKYIGFGIGVFTAFNSMNQDAAYWCVR